MPILTEKQRLETVNSFLSSLGYQENEKVYFRLIATTKQNAMKRILPYPLTELPEQYPPFNAFFVVNGGGNTAKEITHWKAIFCEFDDISIEKQKTLYKDLGLPEPTIMLYTGGKSIHCYWAFQDSISKEDGSILQSDLIEFMGADKSNKDISRLFRVPCFKYVDKETHSFNGKTSEIISNSGIKYHYSDLRLAIPFTEKSTNNEVKAILKDFESEGKEYLAYELIKLLPPHKKGSGTYDYYRRFIGAFKNCFPEHLDELIAKLEIESDDGYQWQQISDSTQPFKHNLGTCFYALDYLGVSYSKKALNALKTSMKMLDDEPTKDDNKPNKIQTCYKLTEQIFKENLRFNELTQEIELNGESFTETDDFYLKLGNEYQFSVSKQIAYDVLVSYAKSFKYHPIKDYLNGLKKPKNPVDITKLSSLFFNTNEPIYNRMVYCFLIGAVARIYENGCQMDNLLTLKGEQGIGKSSFFKILFGEKFFTSSVSKDLNMNGLMVMNQHWCCELAELDHITNKKEAGELKSFITIQTDTYRAPYAKKPDRHKRHGVLCATTNKDEFLIDETGNRRFWAIPCNGKINLDWLIENRDSIWYSAIQAYKAKEKWWFTEDEEILVNTLNKTFEVSDAWEETIEKWTRLNSEPFTSTQILKLALNLSEKDMSRQNQMRVANILKKLGFSKSRKQVDGVRDYYWQPPISKDILEVGDSVSYYLGDEIRKGKIIDIVGNDYMVSMFEDPHKNGVYKREIIKHKIKKIG